MNVSILTSWFEMLLMGQEEELSEAVFLLTASLVYSRETD
jgi:hypothetical protein